MALLINYTNEPVGQVALDGEDHCRGPRAEEEQALIGKLNDKKAY